MGRQEERAEEMGFTDKLTANLLVQWWEVGGDRICG